MIGRKLLHLLAFAALAGATALTVSRVVQPAITGDLFMVALLGVMVGLPGLIDRRLAVLSALLLPVTAALLVVTLAPVPPDVAGLGERVAFYGQELRFGLRAYAEDVFPLSLAGTPGLRLLVLLWVYGLVGAASYLALVHGRILAATGALFALMAMCLTVDDDRGGTAIILGFLGLVVLALLTAQGLSRGSWGLGDALSGLLVGAVSLVLAVGVLATAPGIAAQGWQDWRQWNPLGGGNRGELVFNWRQNYPRLLDPQNNVPLMQVTSPVPSYWRANTLDVFTSDSWLSMQSFDEDLGSGPGALAVSPPDIVPPGRTVEQRFELGDIATNYVFTGGVARVLQLNTQTDVASSDAGALRSAETLGPNVSYTLTALVPEVAPEDLVGLGRDYPEAILALYRARPAVGGDGGPPVGRGAGLAGVPDRPGPPSGRVRRPLRSEPRHPARRHRPLPTDAAHRGLLARPLPLFLGAARPAASAPRMRPSSSTPRPATASTSPVPWPCCYGSTASPHASPSASSPESSVGPDTYLVTSNNAHSWVEAYFPRSAG